LATAASKEHRNYAIINQFIIETQTEQKDSFISLFRGKNKQGCWEEGKKQMRNGEP